MTIVLAPLLLAAALPAADSSAIDTVLARVFTPYRDANNGEAAWERPVFSAATARLIAHWQRVMPEGELDGLNDGDWFCQCQDWDPGRFRYSVRGRELAGKGIARVQVRAVIAQDAVRDARFTFVREKAGWRLDDMVSRDFPKGLKAALRQTIAEDEALAREARR